MVGMVESMLYAEQAGLDLSEVIELIGKGAAGCWSINNLGQRIVKEDWAPGFYIKHFLKDMRIALDDSSRMGLNLEGLALAQRFYSLAHSHDWENDGTQALMKIFVRSMHPKNQIKEGFQNQVPDRVFFLSYANISYRRSRFSRKSFV